MSIELIPKTLIRPLEAKDAIQYKQFRLFAFKTAPYAFSESFEDEKELPLAHFEKYLSHGKEDLTLGAFSSNQLVGIITFKKDQRLKALHKSYVHTLFVHPTFRSQKIGHLLVEEVLNHAQKINGLKYIFAWVLDSAFGSARTFYRRHGFSQIGPRINNDLVYQGTSISAEYFVYEIAG